MGPKAQSEGLVTGRAVVIGVGGIWSIDHYGLPKRLAAVVRVSLVGWQSKRSPVLPWAPGRRVGLLYIHSPKHLGLTGSFHDDGGIDDHSSMVWGFRMDALGRELGPEYGDEGAGDVVAESRTNCFCAREWHPVACAACQLLNLGNVARRWIRIAYLEP